MNTHLQRHSWFVVMLMTLIFLIFAILLMDRAAAKAQSSQPGATQPMTDTMQMEQGGGMEEMMGKMMAQMEKMDARMAAMEARMNNQPGAMGSMCSMMADDKGGMMRSGMSHMAEMHAMMAQMHASMAQMHASMAMMASMSEMHSMMRDMGMMGAGGMMQQDGMMKEGGMMGQSGAPADKTTDDSPAQAPASERAGDAQTAMLGDIEVKMTPVDLKERSGDTIVFTVDLNRAAGGLDMDLAKLAFIDAGMEVEAASWEVTLDHGHHVQGTLTFPLTHGGGHRYLDGAEEVKVVLHAEKDDGETTFTWSLP